MLKFTAYEAHKEWFWQGLLYNEPRFTHASPWCVFKHVAFVGNGNMCKLHAGSCMPSKRLPSPLASRTSNTEGLYQQASCPIIREAYLISFERVVMVQMTRLGFTQTCERTWQLVYTQWPVRERETDVKDTKISNGVASKPAYPFPMQ